MYELLTLPSAGLLVLILFRVTLLLAIAWLTHWFLCGRNPRWQVGLWRVTVIGLVAILLCSGWHRGWGPQVWDTPIRPLFGGSTALPQKTSLTQTSTFLESATASANSQNERNEKSTDQNEIAGPIAAPAFQVSEFDLAASLNGHIVDIGKGLAKLYFLIVGILLLRLVLRVLRLRLMLRQAKPADDRLTELVSATAALFELAKSPLACTSTVTLIPLATGIRRPVIVLPEGFLQDFDDQQQRFVLLHECSHFKGRDLAWSLAVRVVQLLLWPHPLAWGISAAHRYACDLRCDGVAAAADSASYSTMLAEMAIKLSHGALPPTAMAFLRRSEVVRRVRRIDAGIPAEQPSMVGRGVAMLAAAAIIGMAATVGVNAAFPVDPDEINHVLVKIVDENGDPVAGAKIVIHGLRARKEPASAHGILSPTDWQANESGKVRVDYRRYVYEEMETGQLILEVSHPDFVRHDGQGHSVDGPILISMTPGRKARITAVDSRSADRITKRLFAMVPGVDPGNGFKLQEAGTLVGRALDPKAETLLIVSLPKEGPALFSDLIDLRNHPAGEVQIDDVVMSPGTRLVGKLSDNVTRPVQNGQVGLAIAATFKATPAYDHCIFWYDFASINEDGTFVFASVPRDVPVQLSAIADGWSSVSASPEQILQRFPYVNDLNHAQHMFKSIVVSQLFVPQDFDDLVLEMEPTSVCRFKIVTGDGRGVPDVGVSMSPNIAWSPGPGGIIGHYGRTSESLLSGLQQSRQFVKDNLDLFFTLQRRFFTNTDANGIAIVKDLPGKNTSVGIHDEEFEMPATGGNLYLRSGNVSLTPGATTDVTITVQPKGSSILGR